MFIAMLLAAATPQPVHVLSVDYGKYCSGTMTDSMTRDRLDRFARKRKAEYEKQGYKVYIRHIRTPRQQGVFQAGNNRLSDRAPVRIMDNGCI